MNIELNKYIKEYGEDSLYDLEKLKTYLLSNNVDTKYVLQLLLIINCSNVKDVLLRSDKISNVVLNSVLINTVNMTGLKQNVVQRCLYDIFIALKVEFNQECLFCFDTEKGSVSNINRLASGQDFENRINTAIQLTKSGNNDDLVKAVNIFGELARQGSSDAMYMLALIKKKELTNEFNGIYNRVLNANEIDSEWSVILELLECAAADGNVNAKAELGDYWYDKQKFEKAYKYYSSPGVVTVKSTAKINIINILNQKKVNLLMSIFGGALLVLMWLFVILNNVSIHNGAPLLGLGIPVTSIATLIYGSLIFCYYKYQYINAKFYVLAMSIIWLVYPIVLVIS